MARIRTILLVVGVLPNLALIGAHGQGITPPRFKDPRPLSSVEIAQVVEASHAAMSGKTFRISPLAAVGGPTFHVQMGPSGGPKYLRSIGNAASTAAADVSFYEYTGRRARSCSGALLSEDLMLTYTSVGDANSRIDDNARWVFDGWTDDGHGGKFIISRRTKSPHDFLIREFDMITTANNLASGPFSRIDGHSARALVRHHELLPGDYSATPIPPESQEYLWIDVDSLFVLRWELTDSGVSTGYAYTFTADPSLDMRPPAGFYVADECVPEK